MSVLDLGGIRECLNAHTPQELDGHDTWAAVAIAVREGTEGPEVFMIKRAEHADDPWSGHMAFPGGRQDDKDADLIATVRREALEEVGLCLDKDADPLGRLDDLQAVARGARLGMVIRPFVFELHRGVDIIKHNYEVAETIWAPLGPMARGEVDAMRPYSFQGRELALPAYDIDGRVVWGLTYHMLRSFLALLQ